MRDLLNVGLFAWEIKFPKGPLTRVKNTRKEHTREFWRFKFIRTFLLWLFLQEMWPLHHPDQILLWCYPDVEFPLCKMPDQLVTWLLRIVRFSYFKQTDVETCMGGEFPEAFHMFIAIKFYRDPRDPWTCLIVLLRWKARVNAYFRSPYLKHVLNFWGQLKDMFS